MVEQNITITRGGIYLAKLNPSKSREVGKIRPVVLLNAQIILDKNPPILFVCPLSRQSQLEFSKLHVQLEARDRLNDKSYALLEHCRAVDASRLIHPRLAQTTPAEIKDILEKLKILVDL